MTCKGEGEGKGGRPEGKCKVCGLEGHAPSPSQRFGKLEKSHSAIEIGPRDILKVNRNRNEAVG